MNLDYEKLIDEIATRLKDKADVSAFKKNRQVSPFVTLLSHLASMPQAKTPIADLMRVKDQVLNRISAPEIKKQQARWFGLASLPQTLRMTAAVLGSLLIVVSLTMATVVSALQSVPGQTIYPLKKVAENIQLKLTPENDKPNLQIQFANNRIDEIQQVIQQQADGQISAQTAQKIVAANVQDLQKNTAAATKVTTQQPQSALVNKLADLTDKLKIASIRTDGEVKIELQKAVQTTQDSKQQAIQNLVSVGIKIVDQPIVLDSAVSTSGKLTAVSSTSVSLGTIKFLITKDTKYINMTSKDLAVDQAVDITGTIKDNKTYAVSITLVSDPKDPVPTNVDPAPPVTIPSIDTKTDTSAADTNPVTPSVQ